MSYIRPGMLQAQGIIPKRRPSVTTNTYDRPSPSTNDPIKGERKIKRRSMTKEPSIVRQCENAIQRDEVTRLRVRMIICYSGRPSLISNMLLVSLRVETSKGPSAPAERSREDQAGRHQTRRPRYTRGHRPHAMTVFGTLFKVYHISHLCTTSPTRFRRSVH